MKSCKLIILLSVTISIFSAPNNNSISLLSYNVENLFDAEHDAGKNDWNFLPKNLAGKREACEKVSNPYYRKQCLNSDWTQVKYQKKLETIKTAILSNVGKLPSMMALIEVESESVVSDLAKKMGYKNYISTNSPDKRGIDVALMYNESKNLKVIDSSEYVVVPSGALKKPTRNILEVTLNIHGEQTFLYVNHWPSQGAKSPARIIAAKKLKEIISYRKAFNPRASIIATGDFNTVDRDYPHPFKTVVEAGNNPLSSVHELFMNSRDVDRDLKSKTPLGSYFYIKQMSWNLLDRFFISQNLLDGQGLDINLSSYRILTKGLTRDFNYDRDYNNGTIVKNIPLRYDHQNATGFSDHFPIMIKFTKK